MIAAKVSQQWLQSHGGRICTDNDCLSYQHVYGNPECNNYAFDFGLVTPHSKLEANGCLAKAGEIEPIFVLLARDESAPFLVMNWLDRNPQISGTKKAAAEDCVRAMFNWQHQHGHKKAD